MFKTADNQNMISGRTQNNSLNYFLVIGVVFSLSLFELKNSQSQSDIHV